MLLHEGNDNHPKFGREAGSIGKREFVLLTLAFLLVLLALAAIAAIFLPHQ